MSTRASIGVVVMTIAVLATGCSNAGDDSKPHAARTARPSPTETSTTERGQAADVRTELTTFSDPTGNIGCAIDEGFVRCDVAKHTWKPPKAPSSCDLDFGQGITIQADAKAAFVCAGDTTLGAKKTLSAHQAIQVGVFGCHSDEGAIVCSNEDTGHGFSVSRSSYDLY